MPIDVQPAHATKYPLTGQTISFAKLFQTHLATAARVARLRGR
ncbi:MAG: hypothetical protein ACR2KK_22760 [Acidimicrobiales bacterium]